MKQEQTPLTIGTTMFEKFKYDILKLILVRFHIESIMHTRTRWWSVIHSEKHFLCNVSHYVQKYYVRFLMHDKCSDSIDLYLHSYASVLNSVETFLQCSISCDFIFSYFLVFGLLLILFTF